MSGQLLIPGGILSLSDAAAVRLISAGNGDAALLYLQLLRKNGAFDRLAASQALHWDASRTDAAFQALVTLALAAPAQQVPAPPPPLEVDEPPEYSAADIAKELEEKASPFSGLVNEVQRCLGKVLSTADLKTLYMLYDYLALPAEVLLLLVHWCVEEQTRKYGPGRLPRMSQIRKEAFLWQRQGVDSAEAAEVHLKRLSGLRTRAGGILPLLGIQGRQAMDAEAKYIAAWVEMGFGDDAIRLAYERTVFKKQNMNWPYMHSILRSWHQKGLHTVAEIKEKDSGLARASGVAPAGSGGKSGAPTQDDVAWMREFLAQQNAENTEKGGR